MPADMRRAFAGLPDDGANKSGDAIAPIDAKRLILS
jgi:hypothetical protein